MPRLFRNNIFPSDDRNEQIARWVREKKDWSRRDSEAFRARLPVLYNLYRGSMRSRYSRSRNNVHIPLIFSTIQSDIARKLETLFSSPPYVDFVGYGPNDAAIARKQESLVSAQMEDMGMFLQAYHVFLAADLYGTAVILTGWDYQESKREIRESIALPLSGDLIQSVRVEDKVIFDGPCIEVPDLLDCYPQPGYNNIAKMQWFIIHRTITKEVAIALANYAPDGGEPFFDPQQVQRMLSESGGAQEAEINYKEFRFSHFQFESPETTLLSEPNSDVISIDEYYGYLPAELTPDGVTERIITVANGRYVFRSRPIPTNDGSKPVFAFQATPDPHHFFAIGKAEATAKLQIVANRFTNQQLDALDSFINPSFVYNSNNINENDMYLAPGRAIPANGSVNDSFLAIQPDLRGIEFGTAKTAEVWRWIQQTTGIVEDVGMGLQSQRQTAREFVGRQEAVATRLISEARMAEKLFVEPVANTMMADNRVYLSLPRELTILGDNAQIDPASGQEIQISRVSLTPADLAPHYYARARGAISKLSKGVASQNMITAMQLASSNPVVAGAVNWVGFFRELFINLEIKNINEIISTQQEFKEMRERIMSNAPSGKEDTEGQATNSPLMAFS